MNDFVGLKSRSWIEISKEALEANLVSFKSLIKTKTLTAAVVKANAYGHSLEIVAPLLDRFGVDWFGVDRIEEALRIRNLRIAKPILILGYTFLDNLKTAIENDVSVTVYSLESLEKIKSLQLRKKAKIHLKIETGLNRQGVSENNLQEIVGFIRDNRERFILEGVSTHFADIEDTLDLSFAFKQRECFNQRVISLERAGLFFQIKHCGASAACLLYPQSQMGMVRLGIGLYGLWPSKKTRMAAKLKKRKIFLKPVLAWRSKIVQVKYIKAGESVGYGRTWLAPKQSKIAIVPIGYSDGYPRGLSNRARVLVKGCFARVIGRVAMNMMAIEVTAIENIKLEERVTLLGQDGRYRIEAEELADQLRTINYEIISRINQDLPRLVC